MIRVASKFSKLVVATTLSVALGATNALADIDTERVSRSDLRKIANELNLSEAKKQFSNYTIRARESRLGNQFYYLQPNGKAYYISVGLTRPLPGRWGMKRENNKNLMCVQFPGLLIVTRRGVRDSIEKVGGPGCLPVNFIGSSKDPLSGPIKEKAKGDIFNMRSGKWPFKQVGRSGTLNQLYKKFNR